MALRPTRAYVDLEAISQNVAAVRQKIGPGRQIMAMVKADGYGHGALPVSLAALKAGATWLGVALPEEGIELRQAGIQAPILVAGPIQPEEADKPIMAKLDQAVCSLELAEALNQAASRASVKARIHLKVETGMGRVGFWPEEVVPALKRIGNLSNLEVIGLFSHFSSADEADKSFSSRQLKVFDQVLAAVAQAGFEIKLRHIANSAAILDLPEAYYDLVRPGIMIYGLYPSAQVSQSLKLKPAMTLATKISHLKIVPPGTPLGYGRTFVTTRPTAVATLPIGYADGYSRLLSNRSQVLVKGQRAPVIGRICMDMTLVDVTDLGEVRLGEEVVLFGHDPSADEVAGTMGTISYELVCAVSKRVPRVYLGPERSNQGGEDGHHSAHLPV